MVDEHIFAQSYEPAEIGMEGRDHPRAGVYPGADDFAQALPNLSDGSSRIHPGREPDGPVDDRLDFRIFRVIEPDGVAGFQPLENIPVFKTGEGFFF